MEQQNVSGSLKEGPNAQALPEQTTPVVDKSKRVKPVCVVLATLASLILVGGIVGGVYLLRRETRDQESEEGTEVEEVEEEDEQTKKEEAEETVVEIYFAKPSSYEDFQTLVAVERRTSETDLYKYTLDQLILGPTDEEESKGFIAAFELIGFSECGDNDYELELSGSELTINFCRNIAANFNQVEEAWAGITLSAEGRAYEAISETLKFDSIEKVVVKDKYGACFAVSAGVNEDCVE